MFFKYHSVNFGALFYTFNWHIIIGHIRGKPDTWITPCNDEIMMTNIFVTSDHLSHLHGKRQTIVIVNCHPLGDEQQSLILLFH